MSAAATVQSLHLYPVKSCRGIDVERWPLDAHGLRHDRKLIVTKPDGFFVTQRELPVLATIATAIEAAFGDGALILSCAGHGTIRVPLAESESDLLHVRIWRDHVLARGTSAEADAFFTAVCGEPLRLMRYSERERRAVDPRWAEGFETEFADGYPVLVIGQASLDDLNARLAEPVTMDRFRPNVVVRGAGPFAEDAWRDLDVGDAAIRIVKPCGRCVIVTTDQRTGERSPEPLRTLATYRRSENEVMFGQNAVVTKPAVIAVGDAVRTR